MASKKISCAVIESGQVVIAEKVKHAFNPLSRMKGLLGTKSLPSGHGLWLKPCSSIHTVGMAYAIDILFLDKNKKIVKAKRNIRPMRLCWAPLSTRSVLELPKGAIERYGVIVGDGLKFKDTENSVNTHCS